MSDFAEVCDALIADLQESVPGCRDTIVHRYAPWDPEELVAKSGEKHLAVWPAPEAENAEPLYIGGHMLRQRYAIAYWEYAADLTARGTSDEAAAADLLDLQNAVRARLYALENANLAGAMSLRYSATLLPSRQGTTRWFVIVAQLDLPIEFT